LRSGLQPIRQYPPGPELRVDTVLGEGLRGQIVGEFFDPGDFYDDGADVAWYARWQITASF